MTYSLILEDGTVVRKSETLVNFVRNCFFDHNSYYGAFADIEEVGNSFDDKREEIEPRYNGFINIWTRAFVSPKYIAIDKNGKIVPKCRMKNILDILNESCAPKKMYARFQKAKNYPGFRREPVSYTGYKWRRNSPQHFGKIGIVPETRNLEAYEIYRREHPEYRLPKSRYGELPKNWDIHHKYNVRGKRDWKRTKVKKQWMKSNRNNSKQTGINVQKEKSIKDLKPVKNTYFSYEEMYDEMYGDRLYNKNFIKDFEKNYEDEINEELESPKPFDQDQADKIRNMWEKEFSHYDTRYHLDKIEQEMEKPYLVIRDWHYWQDRHYGYAA